MSSIDSLTWEEFQKESLELLDISKKLNDTWSWVVKVSFMIFFSISLKFKFFYLETRY